MQSWFDTPGVSLCKKKKKEVNFTENSSPTFILKFKQFYQLTLIMAYSFSQKFWMPCTNKNNFNKEILNYGLYQGLSLILRSWMSLKGQLWQNETTY